jgi:hypothetical protein
LGIILGKLTLGQLKACDVSTKKIMKIGLGFRGVIKCLKFCSMAKLVIGNVEISKSTIGEIIVWVCV